ncbi:hypothetical protein [Paenibacillus taichungensis]|uniref:hypothetical protein n=1 Tax=Paenibacillus taichungensis TaxID=484184 RepID=UPI003D9A2970
MNEPKTPNLGLNKIDRTSPSTTYFDLNKYLDLNWEKVDEGVGQVEEKAEENAAKVSSIQERLDTEKRRSVTLESGLRIVNADCASAFKLEGLKGRTLVNLLGRAGGCESTAPFSLIYGSASPTSFVTSTTDRTEGGAGIRATWDSENTGTSRSFMIPTKLAAGKYYIGIADLSTSNVGMAAFIAVRKGDGSYHEGSRVSSIAKSLSFVSFQADGTELATGIYCVVMNLKGNIAFDSIRLYEIDSVQFNDITRMSNEMIASSYPYVDSVQPVRNPYAIRYGENLLPPFYEAEIATGVNLTAPYSLSFPLTGSSVNVVRYWVPVVEGETYTLTPGLVNGDNFQVIGFADDKSKITMNSLGVVREAITFTVPSGSGTKYLRLTLISGSLTGIMVVDNPMLVVGTESKPFVPREDAMLALQTDLYADPVTGANADQLFEKDGQYFKLAKWKSVTLDGLLLWRFSTNYTGFKRVAIDAFAPGQTSLMRWGNYAVKYDGNLLMNGTSSTAADVFDVSTDTGLYVTISNADSGWGDSYTPTADEIKAYFMGWIMYLSGTGGSGKNGITPYNGTGTKYWARVASDGNTLADGTAVLPTTQAPNYTSYQLVYQLATPSVEPITSEGQLTLIEGNNQVEVGTGIVLRESNKPGYVTNTYYFNDTYYGSTLKFRVDKVLGVYRNNVRDYKAIIYSGNNQYGNQKARLDAINYDPSAAYSVTYLMLDSSPVVAFVGSVPDNEKALLTDLVQDVQQANARLSVVENKKAEKDVPAPVWITPTLLNSWVRHSTARPTLRYYKDSQGVVHLEGVIRSGVVTSGTALCNLPAGYRPALTVSCVSYSSNGTTVAIGLIDVLNGGTIQLGTTGTPTFYNGLMFIGLSFLAEQ